MIATGISNGWEFSVGEIVGIAAFSIVSGVTSGRSKSKAMLKDINEANSFAKKIRGRINSGYYNKKGHAASSIASASRAANQKILSIHFGKAAYKDYGKAFGLTFANGLYSFFVI